MSKTKEQLITEFRAIKSSIIEKNDKIRDLVTDHNDAVDKANKVQYEYSRLLDYKESKLKYGLNFNFSSIFLMCSYFFSIRRMHHTKNE